MRREEGGVLSADAERPERIGQHAGLEVAEAPQRRDHRGGRAEKPSRARVRGELAAAAVPHDDHRREETEHHLHRHYDDVVESVPAAAPASLALPAKRALHDLRGDVREEDHERIDHALREAHRHHVPVRDVRHLVREHSAQLLLRHLAHDVRRDRDERRVLEGSRRERVRRARVDRDFGGLEVGAAREVLDRGNEPALRLPLRPVDYAALHRRLHHRLREEERDQRARHAENERERQQRRKAAIAEGRGEVNAAQRADHARGDREHRHRGDVRHQKEK